MDEFLSSNGWFQTGACGCSPKRYSWKNDSIPNTVIKTIPTRQTWQLFEYDRLTMNGQNTSLETQYNAKYKQQ